MGVQFQAVAGGQDHDLVATVLRQPLRLLSGGQAEVLTQGERGAVMADAPAMKHRIPYEWRF
ncbi:MAG: hypothetical protein Kow00106_00690 [Anaerolineae bacterium]